MKLTLTTDLEPLKDAARRRIDEAAELTRLQFITNGSGQQMVYQEKYNEAVTYMATPGMNQAEIPHIVAEVGITGSTVLEVATTIIATRNQWLQVSPVIEQKRLAAKKAVTEATTPAAIEAAAEVDWSFN